VTLRVSLVADPGREEDAAWRWLDAHPGLRAQRFAVANAAAALAESDVLWVHAASPLGLPDPQRVAAWVSQGGGLLLTLRAAQLVGPLGLESSPPADLGDAVWRHEADEWWGPEFRSMSAYPHVRGIAAYGPHPLVTGLHNGTYCWAPAEGEPYAWACYGGGARPTEGHAVGVERAYIVQNAERVVAWEYQSGRGRVLCVGAYAHFAAPDPLLRPQLEALAANAIACVAPGAGGAAVRRSRWPLPGRTASPSKTVLLPDPLDLEGKLPDPAADPIVIEGPVAGDEPWDLAGRRLLMVGREGSGLREVWTHPHRSVAAWQVLVEGRPARGGEVAVSADVVRRVLHAGRRRIAETAYAALEQPMAVVEYRCLRSRRESDARAPVEIELLIDTDLRRMWPFAAGCGGNLRYQPDPQGRVAMIEAESGDGVVAILLGRAADVRLEPRSGDRPAVRCVIRAALDAPLRVAVVGGADRDDFDRNLRAVRRLGVDGLVRQRTQRAVTVREARLGIRSDDPGIDRAVEWAKRRLDLFLGDAPGVGRSLFAGYAPSTPGWGDGRPGYAWFFGRDACWASFALLATGEFSLVRQVLRFLGDRQDVTGKVLHEATTSGQFHYDAADATPLYLLLVARYLAWTGDTAFVASIWPRVERAYQFCLGTDADGDGLIENARVGHGWIEDGPLAGARVTLYLAALWRAALEALAVVADALGNPRLHAECAARAARAGAAIEDRFHDGERRGYALDLRADGSRTMQDTALAAVPVLLRAVNPLREKRVLDALGGAAFSAPWGVRLLPLGDPLFRETGYHQGSVWPLFTGWASLAEYLTGRGEAGFRHFAANARLAFVRQKGAFDEVLHGTEERSAGVCPDQAWSASMVLQPLVEGMLGVEPDAPLGRLVIAPQLPAAWSALDVQGLRCAGTTYDLKLRRRGRELSFDLRRTAGEALWVTLAPWLAEVPASVVLDDHEIRPSLDAWGEGIRAAVSFQATGEHTLRVTPA
jgi:glycogen debranching enzyme